VGKYKNVNLKGQILNWNAAVKRNVFHGKKKKKKKDWADV